MKWVKVAIGAVIAIISIGIIATSVYNLTQEKVREEIVTFEILTETTVTSGTYDLFAVNASLNTPNDITDIYINDIRVGGSDVYNNASYILSGDPIRIEILEYDYIDASLILIYEDDIFSEVDYVFQIGDTISITFEVTTPAQLTGITATLILLTPLIFAGGVLAYLLNKQNY